MSRLSHVEALAYCRYIEEREPVRLADLAWWMQDSGGDVQSVTATLEGADRLWEWFLQFLDLGMPGVPDDAVRAESIVRSDVAGADGQEKVDPDHARLEYVHESLKSFLRLVWENYRGPGQWLPYGDPTYFHFQTPILSGSDWADFCFVLTVRIMKGDTSYRQPNYLSGLLQRRDPRLASRVPASTEPVLVRFLSEPRPAWDDPRRWPPKFGYRPEPKDPMEKFLDPEVYVDEFGIVSTATRDVSDEAVMAPLDADKVAQALEAFGFTTRERVPVTAEQLRADDVELANTAGFAQVETTSHVGQLVAVWVEPIYPDHRGWKRLMPRFTKLARELGGRIYRDIDA